MNKKMIFQLLLFLIVGNGCSLKPAYYNFVDMMDEFILYQKTIDTIGYVGKAEYLVETEFVGNSREKHHFALPRMSHGRFCHYYLVVDNQSSQIISWGFDYEKSDPRKNCGISG